MYTVISEEPIFSIVRKTLHGVTPQSVMCILNRSGRKRNSNNIWRRLLTANVGNLGFSWHIWPIRYTVTLFVLCGIRCNDCSLGGSNLVRTTLLWLSSSSAWFAWQFPWRACIRDASSECRKRSRTHCWLWQARPNEVDITVSSSRWGNHIIAGNYDTLLYTKKKKEKRG